MKKFLAITLAGFFFLAFTVTVCAQDDDDGGGKVIPQRSVKDTPVRIESSRGADPHIKVPIPPRDEQTAKPVTPEPRGPGADHCKVTVCNNTGYYIYIYVDGRCDGMIGPYDNDYTIASYGSTKVYGKSYYGTLSWGDREFECNYENTWELNP